MPQNPRPLGSQVPGAHQDDLEFGTKSAYVNSTDLNLGADLVNCPEGLAMDELTTYTHWPNLDSHMRNRVAYMLNMFSVFVAVMLVYLAFIQSAQIGVQAQVRPWLKSVQSNPAYDSNANGNNSGNEVRLVRQADQIEFLDKEITALQLREATRDADYKHMSDDLIDVKSQIAGAYNLLKIFGVLITIAQFVIMYMQRYRQPEQATTPTLASRGQRSNKS